MSMRVRLPCTQPNRLFLPARAWLGCMQTTKFPVWLPEPNFGSVPELCPRCTGRKRETTQRGATRPNSNGAGAAPVTLHAEFRAVRQLRTDRLPPPPKCRRSQPTPCIQSNDLGADSPRQRAKPSCACWPLSVALPLGTCRAWRAVCGEARAQVSFFPSLSLALISDSVAHLACASSFLVLGYSSI